MSKSGDNHLGQADQGDRPGWTSGVALVQRYLDRVYRTEVRHAVEHFVIGEADRNALEAAGAIHTRRGAREEVYVLEEAGDLSLAVFIDQAARSTVDRIGEDGVLRLDSVAFADFCVALEGVSHFLLLAHRADADTPVTQLELELQAEVDKYLAARLLAWRADQGPVPAAIARQLFEDFELSGHLDAEERERYRTANRLAMRYCDFLERAFLREQRIVSMLRELRRFFRAPQSVRLTRIAA